MRVIPRASKNSFNSPDIKAAPRSVWIFSGIPKIQNNKLRLLITVSADKLGTGNENGNLENSSTAFSMYLLVLFEGRGPLKSRLMRSKGLVACISDPLNLQNFGLTSAQVRQLLVNLLTSSMEKGRFFDRMKCIILTIPG